MVKLIVILTSLFLLGAGSCASTFPYRWYAVDPPEDLLKGPKEKYDLPLTKTCSPDEVSRLKCVAILVEDFDRLVADYIEKTERLRECEKR